MITVGVIGDFSSLNPNSTKVAKLVKSWNPEIILTVGDNLYLPVSEKNYATVVGSLYKEYLTKEQEKERNKHKKIKKHIKLTLKDHSKIPCDLKFLPCVGNHDYPYNQGYIQYFGLDTYYATEFIKYPRLVKFISLNNYIDPEDGSFDTQKKNTIQKEWLKNELKLSNDFKWIVVYFHYPQICTNNEFEDNEQLKKKFPFYLYPNVKLILSGHHHIYERLLVNGICNIIIGTSGHSIYNVNYNNRCPESLIIDNSGFGGLKLNINFDFIEGTYFVVDKNNNGQEIVKDNFIIK